MAVAGAPFDFDTNGFSTAWPSDGKRSIRSLAGKPLWPDWRLATSGETSADSAAGGCAELVLPARFLAVNGSTVSLPEALFLDEKRFNR
jgi:hypothetical protein